MILGSYGGQFGIVQGWFWGSLETILGLSEDRFGVVLGSFGNRFGVVLGSSGVRFCLAGGWFSDIFFPKNKTSGNCPGVFSPHRASPN